MNLESSEAPSAHADEVKEWDILLWVDLAEFSSQREVFTLLLVGLMAHTAVTVKLPFSQSFMLPALNDKSLLEPPVLCSVGWRGRCILDGGMWRPEVNLGCLPQSRSTSGFEI